MRLEQFKEEQRKIEKEAEEQAKIEQMEELKQVEQAADATETLIDTAPELVDKAPQLETPEIPEGTEATVVVADPNVSVSKKTEEKALSASSLSDLKSAIESLDTSKTEKETINEIKKELEDYDQDVRELDEIKNLTQRPDLQERKSAKNLSVRVNKMLARTNAVVDKLMQKEQQEMQLSGFEHEDEHKEKIVTIQEIVEAVTKLQKSPNQTKVDQISQVCLLYL